MPYRPSRLGVGLVLAGVLTLFVGVIAQLAVTDGIAEMLWVLVSIAGAGVILTGIVVLVRAYRAMLPPED